MRVLDDVLAGRFSFLHFGLPCTSWGSAGILSGGSRRKWRVYGQPGDGREDRANLQAERMCVMIAAAVSVGTYFCVENRHASMVFDTMYVEYVRSLVASEMIEVDQCQYGLRPPDGRPV